MNSRSRLRTSTSIEPAFGWTWLSRDAVSRAKAQMDEESTGARDEIGFLLIQQRYADHFFPGTSVLHMRARYALFVPWLFEDLQGYTGAAASRALSTRETDIAGWLKDAGESKVIGRRVHPKPASQPPSMVYWNALTVWGILRPGPNGRAMSRAEVHRLLAKISTTKDDDGQPLNGLDPPFIRLPERPSGWLTKKITLRLTKPEAAFLRERLSRLCPHGSDEPSLLARLVRTSTLTPSGMWAQEVYAVAGPDRCALLRAEHAAAIACVGRAIYDALVEYLIEHQDGRPGPAVYLGHLRSALEQHGPLARRLSVDDLESDIGVLPLRLREVLTRTLNWMQNGATDIVTLLDAYTAAEARKGTRARLALTRDGRSRRLEWSADLHQFSGPLHYRWEQVSTLLKDLAEAQ